MMGPVPPICHVCFGPDLPTSSSRKLIDVKCVTHSSLRTEPEVLSPNLIYFPLDHTAFLPSYSPQACHTDFIFSVPPLAFTRLC